MEEEFNIMPILKQLELLNPEMSLITHLLDCRETIGKSMKAVLLMISVRVRE